MNILESSSGIVFVYSNLAESGAQLFSMCLEEHGYEPAIGSRLLKDTSNEISRGSKGKYVLFTSETSDSDINKALIRLKRPENANGSDIRVVIASPKVSEGVDFRYVRQIHVLDPWFNMSRIEQVLGRGMRTCSHSLLPFEDQNCSVYLHVSRYPKSKQETLDEFIYRVFVEGKARKIAKVKRIVMESAMDCPLQKDINSLPYDWSRELKIPQKRAQDGKELMLSLSEMSAPTFEDTVSDLKCNIKEPEKDTLHDRPLSAILDVRDEVLDKIMKLFLKKSIWKREDLYNYSTMKQYTPDVLDYVLQNAIETGFTLTDKQGRVGHLEAKDGVYSFGLSRHDTMLERILPEEKEKEVALREKEELPEEIVQPVKKSTTDLVEIKLREWLAQSSKDQQLREFIGDNVKREAVDWYIVDNVLTSDEKRQVILNTDLTNPPVYAAPLIIPKPDGTYLFALGSKQIYNQSGEKLESLVGSDKDAFDSWIKKRKDWFIEHKADIFGSMKDAGVIFNMDEKSSEIKRAARAKNIGGRTCTTFKESTLNALVEWLTGEEFPETVKNKKDRCMYVDLIVRQSVILEKEGLFWVTPEEYAIFSEDEHRSELLNRLKEE
jgi:hypothetical protein